MRGELNCSHHCICWRLLAHSMMKAVSILLMALPMAATACHPGSRPPSPNVKLQVTKVDPARVTKAPLEATRRKPAVIGV